MPCFNLICWQFVKMYFKLMFFLISSFCSIFNPVFLTIGKNPKNLYTNRFNLLCFFPFKKSKLFLFCVSVPLKSKNIALFICHMISQKNNNSNKKTHSISRSFFIIKLLSLHLFVDYQSFVLQVVVCNRLYVQDIRLQSYTHFQARQPVYHQKFGLDTSN